jgi:tetratricopeptide (TPR) repeat protein
MNRELIGLTATLWLVVAGSGLAQVVDYRSTLRVGEVHLTSAPEVHLPQMYEDIEILRRILHRTLLEQYGFASSAAGKQWSHDLTPNDSVWLTRVNRHTSPPSLTEQSLHSLLTDKVYQSSLNAKDFFLGTTLHWPTHTSLAHDYSEAEGTYLKGHGVVYSLTLPPPPQDPLPAPAKSGPKPLSQWERVRKELRGEKVEAADAQRTRQDVRLADAVLKVLADNGQHFTQLGDNEQLTVAITFRGGSCVSCHAAREAQPAKPGGGTGRASDFDKPSGGKADAGGGPRSGSGGGTPGSFGGIDAFADTGAGADRVFKPDSQVQQTEVQNYLLLGDLHLKQGRAKEAVTAYQKALDLHQKPAAGKPGDSQAVHSNLTAIELQTKLAQAYLSLGDQDSARKTLHDLAGHARGVEELVQVPRGRTVGVDKPSAAGLPLPAKLIISAPKKLLTEAGAGKISYEEFKKAASVQYLTFPAPEKKPGASGSAGDK